MSYTFHWYDTTKLPAGIDNSLSVFVYKETTAFNDDLALQSKEDLLRAWDEATPQIEILFNAIPEERFHEEFNLFGEYKFPIIDNILYFIDNEIHHRAQGFVYLRLLKIEPPHFWERF